MSKVNMLHMDMVVLTRDGRAHTVIGWCFYGPILVNSYGEEWINFDNLEELFYVD